MSQEEEQEIKSLRHQVGDLRSRVEKLELVIMACKMAVAKFEFDPGPGGTEGP